MTNNSLGILRNLFCIEKCTRLWTYIQWQVQSTKIALLDDNEKRNYVQMIDDDYDEENEAFKVTRNIKLI